MCIKFQVQKNKILKKSYIFTEKNSNKYFTHKKINCISLQILIEVEKNAPLMFPKEGRFKDNTFVFTQANQSLLLSVHSLPYPKSNNDLHNAAIVLLQ